MYSENWLTKLTDLLICPHNSLKKPDKGGKARFQAASHLSNASWRQQPGSCLPSFSIKVNQMPCFTHIFLNNTIFTRLNDYTFHFLCSLLREVINPINIEIVLINEFYQGDLIGVSWSLFSLSLNPIQVSAMGRYISASFTKYYFVLSVHSLFLRINKCCK